MALTQAEWDIIFDPLLIAVQRIGQLRSHASDDGTIDLRTRIETAEGTLDGLGDGTKLPTRLILDSLGAAREGYLREIDFWHNWMRSDAPSGWLGLVYERMRVDGADVAPRSSSAFDVVDALLANMPLSAGAGIAQTVDQSSVSGGTVTLATTNGGNASATVDINTTHAEMAIDGEYSWVCRDGRFSRQGSESWDGVARPLNAAGRSDGPPRSLATTFRTGFTLEDWARNQGSRQTPLFGGGYYSGLGVTISEPSYTTFVETDNSAGTAANPITNPVFFGLVDAGKTVLNRWNTTYAYDATNGNGTVHVRCVDNGGNWDITIYQDSGFTVQLTNTVNFVEGGGDVTAQAFTVVASNPSARNTTADIPDPSPFLNVGDTFCTFDLDDSEFTAATGAPATFTNTVQGFLPPHEGDSFMSTITNDYAGAVQREVVDALGVRFDSAGGGAETISDPTIP